MFPIMKTKSSVLLSVIEQNQSVKGIVDVHDVCLRFTVDVLASSALGVEANSLQNGESPFNQISKSLLGPTFIFHIFAGSFFPSFHRTFQIRLSKNEAIKFFVSIVKQITDNRKDPQCERKDFVQKLLNAKEGHLYTGERTSIAGK